jgi:hypothetical protein
MLSDLVDIRIKGFEYAADPKRVIDLTDNKATFRGDHKNHHLKHRNRFEWQCDCSTFARTGIGSWTPFCSHSIALEKMIESGVACFTGVSPGGGN